MGHFELLKLATDALLVLGLFYFCVRFLRSQGPSLNTREVKELESALRTLIKEADTTSRSLNDALARRHQSLERLLSEIESAEGRVHRTLRETAEPAVSRPAAPLRSEEPAPVRAPAYVPPPEPPSFAGGAAAPEDDEPRSWSNVNIYGEPIGRPERQQPAPAPAAPRSKLAQSIERSVEPETPHAELEQVYNAAEQLIRAGQDLESVARRTNLPLDEVRMLSQMVIREQQAQRRNEPAARAGTETPVSVVDTEVAPGSDPRLGVLAPIKRQVQTL